MVNVPPLQRNNHITIFENDFDFVIRLSVHFIQLLAVNALVH